MNQQDQSTIIVPDQIQIEEVRSSTDPLMKRYYIFIIFSVFIHLFIGFNEVITIFHFFDMYQQISLIWTFLIFSVFLHMYAVYDLGQVVNTPIHNFRDIMYNFSGINTSSVSMPCFLYIYKFFQIICMVWGFFCYDSFSSDSMIKIPLRIKIIIYEETVYYLFLSLLNILVVGVYFYSILFGQNNDNPPISQASLYEDFPVSIVEPLQDIQVIQVLTQPVLTPTLLRPSVLTRNHLSYSSDSENLYEW